MAMANIKSDEERARLDSIFAEVEAELRGEKPELVDTRTQEQIDAYNRQAKIDRLANLGIKEFVGNVKANIGNNAFTTMWEKIMSQFIVNSIAPMNTEINLLRNFANAVGERLEKAERSAMEQDNHHYYKIFAEGVRDLLDKL